MRTKINTKSLNFDILKIQKSELYSKGKLIELESILKVIALIENVVSEIYSCPWNKQISTFASSETKKIIFVPKWCKTIFH